MVVNLSDLELIKEWFDNSENSIEWHKTLNPGFLFFDCKALQQYTWILFLFFDLPTFRHLYLSHFHFLKYVARKS